MKDLKLDELKAIKKEKQLSMISFCEDIIKKLSDRIENFDMVNGRIHKLTIEEHKENMGVDLENRIRDVQTDDEFFLYDDSLQFKTERLLYWKNLKFKLQYDFEASMKYMN